jgi:hypothetical protein
MSSFEFARPARPILGTPRPPVIAQPVAPIFTQPVVTVPPISMLPPITAFPTRPIFPTHPTFPTFPTFPLPFPVPTPPPPGRPEPEPPPPPPVSTPTELMTVLTAVPLARDGDVITAAYHNALREAVLAVAAQLGVSLASRLVTVSVAPSFLPIGDDPTWKLHAGFASNFVGESVETTVRGWAPLELPDATRIQNITVTGTRSGAVESLSVRLVRLTISDEAQTQTVLATLQLGEIASPFRQSAQVHIPDASAAVIEEYKVVDNTRYKYLALAELRNAAGVRVQLNGLQVACLR